MRICDKKMVNFLAIFVIYWDDDGGFVWVDFVGIFFEYFDILVGIDFSKFGCS